MLNYQSSHPIAIDPTKSRLEAGMLAIRDHAHLVVVDVQEQLVPAIHEAAPVIANITRLIAYARILSVPTTFTEHVPERIGPMLPTLREASPPQAVCLRKANFSSLREPALADRFHALRRQRRDQIVLCGMEAHVCVMQTGLDLLAAGFEVLLVADAVGSRSTHNRDLAINRMSKAGAAIISHEMIAFEWLERGDTPEFKDILAVLK